MYCLPLSHKLVYNNVGGKAFNLSLLKQLKFPVPDGFVISNEAFEKHKTNDPLFWNDLKSEIEILVKNSGATKFMVRSSAVGEDSESNSFAGQLESFISSSQTGALQENIIKCWKSYSKENVNAYQNASGQKLAGMGVIIQELIEPDFAGVLFTRSFSNEENFLLEYVKGHGEQLVSGKINPFSLEGNRKAGNQKYPAPFPTAELFKHGRALETLFQKPQDIEWVVKNKETFIVQTRPITTETGKRKLFWSNTNVNENYPSAITPLLYSIARDSYYNYFKNLSKLLQVPDASIQKLEADYTNIIGIFACRMYYNMSSIHRIMGFSPFSKMLMKSFNNFVGYQQEEKKKSTKSKTWSGLKFIYSFLKLNFSLESNIRKFEKNVDAFHQETLDAYSFSELRNCFHWFIETRMHSWYRASLADFFAMAFHGMLGLFCKKYFPENHQAVHNKLVQAIPGIVSSKPITETYKIAQLIKNNPEAFALLHQLKADAFLLEINSQDRFENIHNAIQQYLKNWGFRCSGELMLTEKNYCEEPSNFIDLIKGYLAHNQENPEGLISKKAKERERLARKLQFQVLKKRWFVFPIALVEIGLFRLLIKLCFKSISGRERVRLKQALLYARFKVIAIKIGENFVSKGMLEKADDILFLSYKEISEQLSASEMLPNQTKQIIGLRKEEFEKAGKEVFPDDFSSWLGHYPKPEELMDTLKFDTTGEGIKGLSACGGIVKGKARVLENVMQMGKIKPGDILVTRQTDPGWAAIFPLISGLIVERGGMLSHGAIVAREFGIPAIVGVPNATTLIKDGEEIILNADKGEIFKDVQGS
ncbi:MAG: hypothetical protein H0X62_03260 [Bacteroidetes bacterium]|nr:hypothetical protein [Bacteroidota bacterium]